MTSSDQFVYICMYISSENSNVSDLVSVYSLVVKYYEQFINVVVAMATGTTKWRTATASWRRIDA